MRHLQEFRLLSVDGFLPNQRLVVDDLFKEGDLTDVSGTTIGKGFQGGIKRQLQARSNDSRFQKSPGVWIWWYQTRRCPAAWAAPRPRFGSSRLTMIQGFS